MANSKGKLNAELSALWKQYEDYLEPGNKDTSNRMHFPSGIPGLDKALGSLDGMTRGIIQIIGDEATGKTTLALQILAQVQKTRNLVEIEAPDNGTYNALFLDLEHTYDAEYARSLGVDTSKLLVLEMPYAETHFNIAEALVLAGLQFIIIDSIAMVIPEAEEEKGLNDNVKIAGEAALIGRALKRLNALAYSSDTLVLMINQWRSNMSPMAMVEKKPYGARIIKHVIKATIELTRIKREDTRMVIQAFVAKNKMGALGSKITYEIEHGNGIDIDQHILKLALDYDIVEYSKPWWYYPDKQTAKYKGQGDQNAVKNFPMEEIKQLVIEHIQKDTLHE